MPSLNPFRRGADEPKWADKPHPLTVVVGAFSPAVAVAALMIAILGYRTSQTALSLNQQSLKVGQRAYLSVPRGQVVIRGIDESNIRPGPKRARAAGSLAVVIDISNTGNTPATIQSIAAEVLLPPGWALAEHHPPNDDGRSEPFLLRHSRQGEVGPKSTVTKQYLLPVLTTLEAMRAFRKADRPSSPPPVQIRYTLTFTDVFDETHYMKWCWTADVGSLWPAACKQP